MRTLFLFATICFLASCGAQTTLPSLNSDAVRAETEKQVREAKSKAERIWIQETDKWLDDSRKLGEVASKILTDGVKYCEERGHIGPYIGVRAWSKYDFEEKWHETAKTNFRLVEGPQLYAVIPGSPAAVAGLKFGDLILKVNNQPILHDKNAVADFEKKLKEMAKIGEQIEFDIQRGDAYQTISVKPSKACKSQVFLTRDDSIDAQADGENIFVHKGMMEFFNSTEEIALIVSHELAHNSMKHSLVKRINGTFLGGIGILLGTTVDMGTAALLGGAPTNMLGLEWGKLGYEAGLGVKTVELELEADYVAMYFMTLAGYDIESAPLFWRRLVEIDPKGITIRSAHPTSPERFVGMEAAIKEINEKNQAGGLPQRPEQPTIF